MCGIAGIVDLAGARDVDRSALRRMTDALAHRGPDGEGYFFDAGVGLGHRRLAIIDAEGGAQPFHTIDKRGVLTFNGEIYNFAEIVRMLHQTGIVTRTRSDTEALAEAIAKWDVGAISRLRGMFAFGFWDGPRRRLVLARDRFGEKPLYYAQTDDGFLLFSSEIGAIAASGLLSLDLSPAAVRDYFRLGYVPDPHSIFASVHKLPPASVLIAKAGSAPMVETYWRAQNDDDDTRTFDESTAALVEKFDDAVASQMLADAPLGAFLSGGVDSAAIVASMVKNGGGVTACTVGFDDERFDERAFARRTAQRYGVKHIEQMAQFDVENSIDEVAAIYGEPFADPSALPTLAVARAARKHVKVALSGDGADELFLGYRRYAMFAAEDIARTTLPAAIRKPLFDAAGAAYPKLDWAPRPLRLKTTLQSLADTRAHAYLRAVSACLPERLETMLAGEFRESLADPFAVVDDLRDAKSYAQAVDLATWLPGRMLTKIDRASMAAGLEVRTPFLDHEFASWALTLPKRFLLGAHGGKRILKQAMKSRIDANILRREKAGFSIPLRNWLRKSDGPITRLRDSTHWRAGGYISTRRIEQMMDGHQRGAADYSQELWTVIMFDAFLRHASAVSTPAGRNVSARAASG
ncbi:MAG: asparagine synthase (glutamine-hydrolyzing) [Parvularculaceae bacterium]